MLLEVMQGDGRETGTGKELGGGFWVQVILFLDLGAGSTDRSNLLKKKRKNQIVLSLSLYIYMHTHVFSQINK